MKKIVKTNKAPQPVGPYNQAIIHNGTMYISGQIAIDPITKEFLSLSKSISQKELAKGYFVAWELVRSSLEIKGINFTRETSTNMLADQMF